jgi:hypothetical protein
LTERQNKSYKLKIILSLSKREIQRELASFIFSVSKIERNS